ncbi:MAG: SufB/SufD family protein [Phycisphaerae bacterium]
MNAMELIKSANIHAAVQDPDVAHLVIGLNEVVSSNGTDGLDVETEPFGDGVKIRIVVGEGCVIHKPVHMCFGLVQAEGIQKIDLDLEVQDRAGISVIAHCVFPNAENVQHLMDGRIRVGKHASYEYQERHIHSPAGGIDVIPKAVIELDEYARFQTSFELIHGRVGRIEMDYEATCQAHSVLEMIAKISAKQDDVVKIRETGYLVGEHARGVLNSRVAVQDSARADVYNKLVASAAYARGHVDCTEIIQGDGVVSAVPIVEVNHPKAHVTHEAALGSVDTKQLETLMARGLSEDEASDVIIEGLLS